jgi:hypothetical protein
MTYTCSICGTLSMRAAEQHRGNFGEPDPHPQESYTVLGKRDAADVLCKVREIECTDRRPHG